VYTLLVGSGASVLRAAIMAWIGLLGEQIGRRLVNTAALQGLAGFPVLRTDQNGWIEITTDGGQMWVVVERK
jgi:hypothetical protein